MKKLTALILCIAITASALCACGGGEAATNEVRVAYFPNITHAQALYMKDQGIFEKALGDEYSVKWTAFNAGPAEVEALFAGEIDLGYIGPVPAINANVKSQPEQLKEEGNKQVAYNPTLQETMSLMGMNKEYDLAKDQSYILGMLGENDDEKEINLYNLINQA